MLRKPFLRIGYGIALACVPSAVRATTITTAHGNGMDSTLHEDNPSTPLGGYFELEVVRNPGAGSRAFLLRFDLTGYLPGAFTDAAAIELTNYRDQAGPHTVNVYGIPDGATGDTLAGLDEATVTWNNAPGLVPDGVLGDNEDLDPSSVFLGSFEDGAAEGAIDVFSTLELLDFLNADTNNLITFLLTTSTHDPDGQGQVYAPKEATSFSYRPAGEFAPGTHAPRLAFSAASVPEPTEIALLAFGLTGLAMNRRLTSGCS